MPKPTVAASKAASSNGSASTSPCTHSIASDLRRARSSIALGEVEADDLPAAARAPRARGRRCRSRVEHAVAGLHDRSAASRRQRRSSPAVITRFIDVVDRRDPVEHRADAVGRERAGANGHCPHRRTRVRGRARAGRGARDDEVDEVVDGRPAVVEARRERRGSSRPPAGASCSPSRWISESGVSRGTSTSFRSSLSATEAARWIRFAIAPDASVPSVAIEHGQTTYASTFAEPLAYGARQSFSVVDGARRGPLGERASDLVARQRGVAVQLGREHLVARRETQTPTSQSASARRRSRSDAYGAPEAPVMPRKTCMGTSSLRTLGRFQELPECREILLAEFSNEGITLFPNCDGFAT